MRDKENTVQRHMTKEDERAPLLSDEAMSKMMGQLDGWHNKLIRIRRFYEDKITMGELMVVKTAQIIEHPYQVYECSACHLKYEGYRETTANPPDIGEFCRCGAKIIA